MRPHAGKERQEPRGQGLVLKAAAGRLSYAAAVRGLVDNPGSADISQSKLGDFRQPDLDEFLRPVFDENRRPEAADVTGQSPNAVRPPGSDDLTSHGIDGSVRPETNMNPPGGAGTCDRSGSGAVGSGLLQDRRAVLIRTATWTWVAKLKAVGDKAPPPENKVSPAPPRSEQSSDPIASSLAGSQDSRKGATRVSGPSTNEWFDPGANKIKRDVHPLGLRPVQRRDLL